MLVFRLRRSDVTLKAEGFVPGLKISSDPVALKQVLLELISNAVGETPPGGEVVIQAHKVEGGWVELAVADQERVFPINASRCCSTPLTGWRRTARPTSILALR